VATILVVDDRAANRELIATLLRHKGHVVIQRSDGEEALRAVFSERPELVVADILMPVMDGYEFVRRLRADAVAKGTHVIFYTAAFEEEDARVLAADAGVDRVIYKGSDPEVILAEVEAALEAPLPPPGELNSARFHAEHLRVLTEKLVDKVNQLEEANRELDAFAYSISHDLRTPLRGIGGIANILLEDYQAALPAEARRHLATICNGVKQMQHMIGALLEFSRLARAPVNRESIEMSRLVGAVIRDLKAEQAGRRVEFHIGELPDCRGDYDLLRQVLANLLSNALKFTRRREIACIEVGFRDHAYFVRDNGVGFDMRHANRLFAAFQRLHRAEDYEGAGAGLAIVERIIRRHGGRVWADAEPDRGATFWFTVGPAVVQAQPV
jgi:signal transduction histidine kinase